MAFLLRSIIVTVLLLVVAVAALAFYVLANANQFKPELEQLIHEQSGVEVKINGDLGWQLSPPITLTAADITANFEEGAYQLGGLLLSVNLASVIQSRDINQWEVRALTLEDLTIEQAGDTTHLQSLRLTDFRPAVASPFEATLTHQAGDAEPLPLDMQGLIALDPTAATVALTDTTFQTTDASGLCALNAQAKDVNVPADPDNAVIPVAVWRSVDWSGECTLDRLTLQEEDFQNVVVTLANDAGDSSTNIHFPEFFGGSAGVAVDIDTTTAPVAWKIIPDLQRADSQALMSWLDQRLKWIAPLAYSGEITMTGNTREELVQSIKGRTTFDGGKGRIDIAQIKKPLLALATLFRDPERIAAWPELWDYERLIGEWLIDGTHHKMDFALDNLTAAINGDYDPLADALDMDVEFLFEDTANTPGFDVNPVLVGLAIPLNCSGSMEAPVCGVKPDATRDLVAHVLTSEQGAEVREKIDDAIEDKVPEEYQEAARGLLDLLGKSLKKKKD